MHDWMIFICTERWQFEAFEAFVAFKIGVFKVQHAMAAIRYPLRTSDLCFLFCSSAIWFGVNLRGRDRRGYHI
jgi:hypothetical protein